MECLNCKTSNPEDNRFCGACGAALTKEPFDAGAFLRDELPRQIDQAIDAKLSTMTNSEVVEVKATEQVVDRAWKWMTRLAKVIGVPVAVVVVFLGIWGVGSIKDLEKLRKAAETKLDSAIATAETIEAEAKSAAVAFNSQVAKLKAQAKTANELAKQADATLGNATKIVERYRANVSDLEKRVMKAAETVEQAENLEKEVHKEIQETKTTVAEFNKRTRNLGQQLEAVSEKVASLGDLATKTADLATKVADEEGSEKEVKSLSEKVTARVRFDKAFREEKLESKIALYTEAIELDPVYAHAFNNRGAAYYEKGAYDRAIADYDRAIELDPVFALAFNNRGMAYYEKGAYDRAIADYDRAIELDPVFALAFNNRGNAYYKKGAYDRAIADYDKAIEFDPVYALAFYNRGNAYYKKGAYDRAMADYDKAIELDPVDALAFSNRGRAYNRKGAHDQAIADYDKAIELDPSSANAFNGKAWMLATANNAQVRDGREAVRLARVAVGLNDTPNYRDTLAAALAEAGQFRDAVAEQERAIEMLRASGKQDEVANYQSRRDLYRRKQPYRN